MEGVYTALVTPFRADGAIDFPALGKIVRAQVHAGVQGLVVLGTTAESPTLSLDEKRETLEFVRRETDGKAIDLVAGTGTNDTAESIELTRLAASLGYSKFLVVTPYYNKPTQAGLLAHFRALADSLPAGTEGGFVLYNVPSRTNLSFSPATLAELSLHPRVIAVKDASGNLQYLQECMDEVERRGGSLRFLSGDDATYFPFLCLGGHGVISVASHVVPQAMVEIYRDAKAGRLAEARALHRRHFFWFKELFVETNPSPVKWALAKLGFGENRLRLPLVPISEASERILAPRIANAQVKG